MGTMNRGDTEVRGGASSLALPSSFDNIGSRGEVGAVAASCVAFYTTCLLSILFQLRGLGISTGSIRPIPTLAGALTVAAASLTSHQVATRYYSLETKEQDMNLLFPFIPTPTHQNRLPPRRKNNDVAFSIAGIPVTSQALRVCALGLVTFKLLGGRFWAVAPSSFTNLGSFARPRWSIPATENYATTAQRATVQRLGRLSGCHTCGSRRIFSRMPFHGDHMPPKSVAAEMQKRWVRKYLLFGRPVSFRFFPQCASCSNIQGSVLGSASSKGLGNLAATGGGRNAHFHGLRFRTSHLAGAAIGAMTVCGAKEEEILDNGNEPRFRAIQYAIEDGVNSALWNLQDLFNFR